MVVARWCDALLDAVVVVLATWTVVYHASLVAHLSVPWAVGAETLLLAGAAVVCRVRPRRPANPATTTPAPVRPRGPLFLLTILAAAVAAVATATSLPWVWVWVSWLVAASAGSAWAFRQPPDRPAPPAAGRADAPVALVWSVALAAMSTFTLRPNPDDLYYVNLAQWVAKHGTFPVRDTLFSDLGYPMSDWPPMASYDALTGAVAHLAGTLAGNVVYVVVPPLATFLSVLALWRLLRAWRVRGVAVALSAALVFLLFDGTSSYAPPGNLFLTRIWQGKVILVCLLVPLLLVYALLYVERPTRSGALRLLLGGMAAVGLSTTAIFLTPLLAAAGAAPLLRRSPHRALSGFAAMAAYPLAAGAVTLALGGRSADDFGTRRLYRFDPAWFGHAIFLTGPLALVAVFAVLVGCLLVPHPAARVTTGLLALLTGITFVPGLTHLTYAATGLGPTLWRVSWGCSVAALVGVATAWTADRLRERTRHRLGRRWVAPLAAALAMGLLVAFGAPIWSGDTGATWAAPFHWQRREGSRAAADWVIETSRPGDVVLAPDTLAVTVTVTTTDVKTVAPREYFMDYLRDDPAFHFHDRIVLVRFANHAGRWRQAAVTHALQVLGVDIACVSSRDVHRAHAVRVAGFTPAMRIGGYRCLRT